MSILCLLGLWACSHTPSLREGVPVETGTASWYGEPFHGRQTASGETYNMYGISAAHKTLPLGCTVRVTHLGNGRSVVLPINDRGPFVGKRIIDLSYGAAHRLHMVEEGLARVRVEVLQIPRGTPVAAYALQFGAFTREENAHRMAQDLKDRGYSPKIEKNRAHGQCLFRVRLGRFASPDKAYQASHGFTAAGLPCIVIAL